MADFLDTLTRDSKINCRNGYYRVLPGGMNAERRKVSLRESIEGRTGNAIIAEIKRASPSKGTIRSDPDIGRLASAMERGGAAGISVLTEPSHFNGSLADLVLARGSVALPLLMKDIVLDRSQVEAASRMGADAVLLIKAIFDRDYADCRLEAMIDLVHSLGMEVLLEVHTSEEFREAMGLEADLIGVNNRDLGTLRVDLRTTERILAAHRGCPAVVVSESGISSPADVLFLKGVGARAFLVGSSVMLAGDVEDKVRELVEA